MNKKLIWSFLLAAITTMSAAQNAEVVSAYNYLKFNELDKAKASIDKATVDVKTGSQAKTWYYKGMIYQALGESADPKFSVLDANALSVAAEAFKQSIALDNKKQYAEESQKRLSIIAARFANKGVTDFKAKEYASALAAFESSLSINPSDTPLVYNCALSAQNAGLKDKSILYFGKLIEMDYKEPEIYRSLASVYKVDKDTTKALEVIGAGLKKYPTYNPLIIDELNIYLARGKSGEVIYKLELAASQDPTNKSLYFALGVANDNLGKKDAAEAAYKKAIEVDAEYFDANYNMGAMFYNQAVETFNKANQLPASKQKEYDAGIAKSKEQFGKALPYLEKALLIMPKDRNSMISLKEIYARLGDYTKSGEMKKRLEAK